MTRDNQGEVRAGNAFPQQEAKKQNYPVPFVIAHFWSTVIVPNWIFCGLHTATIYMSMVISVNFLLNWQMADQLFYPKNWKHYRP